MSPEGAKPASPIKATRAFAGLICVSLAVFFLIQSRVPPSDSASRRNAPGRNEGNASQADETSFAEKAEAVEAARSVVYALLDAAAEGEVADYLRCFAGDKAAELKALAEERGRRALSEALKEVYAGVKGYALYDTEVESEDRVSLTCELVFAQHNEKQTIVIERNRGKWQVVEMDTRGPLQMLRPYGSPVVSQPPAEAPSAEPAP